MSGYRNTLRKEQSKEELDALRQQFECWLHHREETDVGGRHHSQLVAIGEVVRASCEALDEQLGAIDATGSPGEVYERCREADQRSLFIHRLWGYFRDKWAGRDDEGVASVLEAAEEMVWSCWAPAFRAAGAADVPPAPLPYIDQDFSPHAILRDRPPVDLQTIDGLLSHAVRKLPIPLIGIPPICLSRPWWLAILAHETGHHLEAELGAGAMRDHVTDAIVRAADEAGLSQQDWQRWSRETFADAYGVACVGDAHLWALDELELATDDVMSRDERGPYPPRRVRRMLNLALHRALDGSREPDATAAVAQAVVDAPLTPTQLTLRDLCDWRTERFRPGGEVSEWENELLGEGRLVAEARADVARYVIAGSVRASAWGAELSDAGQRTAVRNALRERLLRLVPLCREPGRRAGADGTDHRIVPRLAEDVARRLLHLDVAAA